MTTHQTLAGKKVLINAAKNPFATLIMSHGAGAPMDSQFMNSIAEQLALAQITTLRFEFDYMAERRSAKTKRPPPKAATLMAEWHDWLMKIQKELTVDGPIYLAGKSMGGRIASLMNSNANPKETIWQGVICLGYPFHPPQKPSQLRTEHLHRGTAPIHIIQGTRDAMGTKEEVDQYNLGQQGSKITISWIATANHDLKPLKKSGASHHQALQLAAQEVQAFVKNTMRLNRQ